MWEIFLLAEKLSAPQKRFCCVGIGVLYIALSVRHVSYCSSERIQTKLGIEGSCERAQADSSLAALLLGLGPRRVVSPSAVVTDVLCCQACVTRGHGS
jgi:hypothetical protein